MVTPSKTPRKPRKNNNPNFRSNLVAPWKPGQSGNPNGRPKRDISQEIAEAVVTQNAEKIYEAYTKALLSGNAYAFQVIADRGFGKLTEKREITRTYQDVPTADLQRRMDELIRDLGLQRRVDEAAGDSGNTGRADAQNKSREAADVLPR